MLDGELDAMASGGSLSDGLQRPSASLPPTGGRSSNGGVGGGGGSVRKPSGLGLTRSGVLHQARVRQLHLCCAQHHGHGSWGSILSAQRQLDPAAACMQPQEGHYFGM